MAKPKGFLLPAEIDPAENCYLIVAIPDHEDYREAFWGAYQRLGYWFSWERDELRRGKDAAARWREAVEETLELWEEIGCMSPLTINVNCGSGHADCCRNVIIINFDDDLHYEPGQYEDIIELPGGEIDDGVNPPPDWIDYTSYQQYKCNTAHEIAQDLYQSLQNVGHWLSGLEGLATSTVLKLLTGDTMSKLIQGLVALGFVTEAQVEKLIAAIANIAEEDTGLLADFESVVDCLVYNDLVCAMFDSTDSAAAQSALRQLWQDCLDAVGIPDLTSLSTQRWEFEAIFAWLTPRPMFETLFDQTVLTETFGGYDCSFCSGAPVTDPVATLANGLLHYWEFEESESPSADSHGTWDLFWNGSGHAVALDGVTGNALSLNGNGVAEKDNQSLVAGGSYTVAGWLKANGAAWDPGYVWTWGEDSSWPSNLNSELIITSVPEFRIVGVQTGDVVKAVSAGVTPSPDAWHLFICEYDVDALEIRLFIDGEFETPAASIGLTGNLKYLSESWAFGGIRNGVNFTNFTASIFDEWAIWDRVLTAEERQALWNVGFGLSYENITNPGGST